MTLSTILIILKYGGTAISGAAGIWGTVSETRDKATGRLTLWGKWALGLAIAGFIVAISSQVAEQFNNNREKHVAEQLAQKNERRLEEQLVSSREQLALARRMAGKIRTIDASITIELDATNQIFSALCSQITNHEAYWIKPTRLGGGEQLGILDQLFKGLPGLSFDLVANGSPTVLASESNFGSVYKLLQAFASPNFQLRFYSPEDARSSQERASSGE